VRQFTLFFDAQYYFRLRQQLAILARDVLCGECVEIID
jgi:hypothetical protein